MNNMGVSQAMRYFVILLVFAGFIGTVYAIPPQNSERLYDISDTIIFGKIILANSTFSPTNTLYHVEVEKFHKNPQDDDIIFAVGPNTENPRLGNQVFDVGDKALLFLINRTEYDPYYSVHYHSFLIKPEWEECDIFRTDFPREHWIFGGRGPDPKVHQQNSTDRHNFKLGQEVTLTYDIFNITPNQQTVLVGLTIFNRDDPDSTYVFRNTSTHSLKPCVPYRTLDWSFTPSKPGDYGAEFDNLMGSRITIGFTVKGSQSDSDDDSRTLSPLKQFESGISIDNIICREQLILVQRHDGSPACVRPETKQKLIERGWTQYPANISEEQQTIIRDLAIQDQSVQKLLDGKDWHVRTIRSGASFGNDCPFGSCYVVLIDQMNRNETLVALVNPATKKVIDVRTTSSWVGDAVFSVEIPLPNNVDPLSQTKITLGEPIDDYDSGVTFSPNYVKTILNHNNTMTWINENKKPVFLESDDGYFKTQINSSESFSAKFNKIGVYKYHSPINWKRGTILVSTYDIESSNLEPASLLQREQYEIAEIIATSLIADDKITNTRLENTMVSAYVTESGADIIVPKSLGILNSLETFDSIQYRYGTTKGLVFPKDEQAGLDFAKRFLEKIGYSLDGSEWIDKVNFGDRIEVTIQQKIQGWIIPNHIVRFDFYKDHTWITLGRWYNDASKYEFKLSQDDAKKTAKDYMDVEVKTRPVFEKYDYSFESIQDGVRVIIFDDKPFYMVPLTYKANADMEYEIGHCGSNQFLTVYVMVEGSTGTPMGWNYPGCA